MKKTYLSPRIQIVILTETDLLTDSCSCPEQTTCVKEYKGRAQLWVDHEDDVW